MRHRALVGLVTSAVLLLAACSSSAATTTPTTATAAVPPVQASSAGGASPAAAGAACKPSADAGQVAVTIKGFAFGSGNIQAKVGQVISFTNGDSPSHTATLDDGSCTTGLIKSGTTAGLVFSLAGTYPFHCEIHNTMKGIITIS